MGNVGAVFLFEWKRSLTLPRMAWWGVLAGFPVFIIGLIRFTVGNVELIKPEKPIPSVQRGLDWAPEKEPTSSFEDRFPPIQRDLAVGFLFALIPMLVTMLGTLLWATPALSTELERRSWVYLAVRPNGATAVLLGKYLAAVTWVIPPALIGLSVAVPVSGIKDGLDIWWAMARLVCLSAPAFAAVYLLLGTILPRRGLVLAVAYSLIFELVVSFIPAIINSLTVHHHLQVLLLEWCKLEINDAFAPGAINLIGNTPPWQHVMFLLLYPPILLAISVAILRQSEFASSVESDV